MEVARGASKDAVLRQTLLGLVEDRPLDLTLWGVLGDHCEDLGDDPQLLAACRAVQREDMGIAFDPCESTSSSVCWDLYLPRPVADRLIEAIALSYVKYSNSTVSDLISDIKTPAQAEYKRTLTKWSARRYKACWFSTFWAALGAAQTATAYFETEARS